MLFALQWIEKFIFNPNKTKMKCIIAIIALISITAACSTTKEVVNTTPSSTEEITAGQGHVPNSPTEHKIIFEDIAKDDSLFASIKRGYCFGTCPVYEMKIYNSGFVTYKGVHAVDMKGNHHTTISYAEMKKLVDLAVEIGYLEMKDEYDNTGVTDLPDCRTSIVLRGKRKQIRRRFDFPKSILVFEKLFDALLVSEKWVEAVKE